MKVIVKQPLFVIILAALCLLLIMYFTQGIDNKSEYKNHAITKEVQELPLRLIIPQINVNANIEYVGITKEGAMDTPSNAVNVGWFEFGPRPGELGSAVIAGHFDGKNGESGVFTNLNKLKRGDKLYVEDNKGKTITFIVSKIIIYDPGHADEVFSRNDGTYLNLITCDGDWDDTKKSYNKRLVVFADLMR